VTSAEAGVALSDPVFSFQDANSFASASDFTATIDWGDGATTMAPVRAGPAPGVFWVLGDHTYEREGRYALQVTVTDIGGSSLSSGESLEVGSPVRAVADVYQVLAGNTLVVSAPGVLGNDSDATGGSLSAETISEPAHGSLTLNSDGSFTYTPEAGYVGPDSFTYQASDGVATSNVATGTIQVTNQVPVAYNDSYGISVNQTLTVVGKGVLSNDIDMDNNVLKAILGTGPSHGTLELHSDGSFIYTPDVGFTGTDQFTYRANDGIADSNEATVTVNIHATNRAPVAMDDSYQVTHNTPLVVEAASGVLTNDTDPDGDPLTAHLVSQPSYGTVTLRGDGSFTYVPDKGFVGTDSFTYQANDGVADSNPATVTIQVSNPAPVAQDDSYSVVHDQTLTISAADGILSNDEDADGDPLTAQLVSDPSHGTVFLRGDGSFLYTPNAHFTGSDSFTYKANDGTADSNLATVTIQVTNQAPVAHSDTYVVKHGQVLILSASPGVLNNDKDPDGDSLTAQLITYPEHGSLSLQDDGSFTYTPDSDFAGTDHFTYKASDGIATSDETTVTLKVVNHAPLAEADTYGVRVGQSVTVSSPGLLANDHDSDGDTLQAIKVSDPSHGQLVLNRDGSFTYTPASDFDGVDFFTYKASDGLTESEETVVTLNVHTDNQPPLAEDDAWSVTHDQSLEVSHAGVLGNDSDPEGDLLTAVLVSRPDHGTVDLHPDGSFLYTPDAHYTGTDSFTYKANDGTMDSDEAKVTITITNQEPHAEEDAYSVTAGQAYTISAVQGVLANDEDPDGDPLKAFQVTNPSHGTLTLNEDGSFTYVPEAGYVGKDQFTYQATDGIANSNEATVTLTVSADPDASLRVSNTTVTGNPVNAQVGVPTGEVPVAFITDADLQRPADAYAATIDWGDHTSVDTAQVSQTTAGHYVVQGDHTYQRAGSYLITITVTTHRTENPNRCKQRPYIPQLM
jgi:VCBS repeat-containing protein